MRLSHAHPLTIAIWRLGFSLIVIATALVVTGSWRQWRRLDRSGVLLALGAGVMLALHFWSWNASVSLTTVAASVVLVNMQPAIVAVLSAGGCTSRRRERSGRELPSRCAARSSSRIQISPRPRSSTTGRALLGDVLALAGAATAACYVVAGRRLRATLDLWPYVALVYGSCFVVLLIFAAMVAHRCSDSRRASWGSFSASPSARCCSATRD